MVLTVRMAVPRILKSSSLRNSTILGQMTSLTTSSLREAPRAANASPAVPRTMTSPPCSHRLTATGRSFDSTMSSSRTWARAPTSRPASLLRLRSSLEYIVSTRETISSRKLPSHEMSGTTSSRTSPHTSQNISASSEERVGFEDRRILRAQCATMIAVSLGTLLVTIMSMASAALNCSSTVQKRTCRHKIGTRMRRVSSKQ
mmetsp:Transcript_2618/g.6953  ORF Transcript_2618/g.6953 Transcript_2618/m.6953 type:complete len:202 (+) Transcript_2618:1905-2510(+)